MALYLILEVLAAIGMLVVAFVWLVLVGIWMVLAVIGYLAMAAVAALASLFDGDLD